MSIVDLVEAEGGEWRLESIAKDFSPLWPVTVESLDKDTIIGANVGMLLFAQLTKKHAFFADAPLPDCQNDCNLFTYSVQQRETKTTLECDGFWNLGEVVNKFITGAVTPPSSRFANTLRPFHSRVDRRLTRNGSYSRHHILKRLLAHGGLLDGSDATIALLHFLRSHRRRRGR